MPVTFGGIDLTPPAFAQAEVDRYWHVHRLFESDHPAFLQGGSHHLPLPYPPRREPPRIGVLHWPSDASRWATCHLLATGEQLTRIQSLSGSLPFDLVFSDGTNSVTAPMYRLPARPVSQRGDNQELYLLTLVDERYYWYDAGDQAAPSPSTWSGLLTSLFTSLGVTPTLDSISANYSAPLAGRWSVGYQPLPLLIDAACRTVGLRCIRTLAGAVSCVLHTTAAASDESQWTTHRYECLAGGRATTSEIGSFVPATCTIVFLGSTPSTTDKTLAGLALSQYGTATGLSGRKGQVVADLPATASAGTRASYATQAATDYYLWQLSRTDATFRGVRSWTPTGLEECVEWVHGADEIVTRVVARPRSDPNTYGSGRIATLSPDNATGSGPTPTQYTVTAFDASGQLRSVPQYVLTEADNNGWKTTQYQLPYVGANPATGPINQYVVSNDYDGASTPRIQQFQFTNGTAGGNGVTSTLLPTSLIRQYALDGVTLYDGMLKAGGLPQWVVGNSGLTQGQFVAPTISGGNVTQLAIAQKVWDGSSIATGTDTVTGSGGVVTHTFTNTIYAGLVVTGYQPLDDQLTALAALTPAGPIQVPYFTGSATMGLAAVTAYSLGTWGLMDAPSWRSYLGLAIGTDVQAYDAELAALAGLTSAADRLPYFTGSGTAALADFTAAARALVDDADASAQRTTLGLGTVATLASDTDGTLAANSDSNVPTQKAVKTYVDTLAAGLKWKPSVRVATTANGTLATAFENGDTVDGVALATGDRILLKDQSTGAENGIYVVAASGAPTRATDADSGTELVSAAVFVQEGTANADKAFVCTNNSITLGSTSITFTGFASVVGALIAANNLSDLASASTARTNLGLGTGDSPQLTGVELGHASDTTLTRLSAGNVAVEGNLLYRAGGTDVAVDDGGSGRTGATAYAVICGGTTSSGAHQSVASVGSTGQVLTSNGAGALPTFQNNVAYDYILLQDQKSAATEGGSNTGGSTQTRTLSNEVADTGSHCSLASNQFTLLAGTYIIRARAPAYRVGRHQISLYNVTDSTTDTVGTAAYAENAYNVQNFSFLERRVTLASSKTFEIRHYTTTTVTSQGFGVYGDSSLTAVYTTVEIFREKGS